MIYYPKRNEAPASLALRKSYTGEDVIKALKQDFCNKCYLCGSKAPTSLNVEHFDEHRGDDDKKYDWQNLFYACGHCNHTKNDIFRKGGSDLLNCTKEDQLVDYWLKYHLQIDYGTMIKTIVVEKNAAVGPTGFEAQIDNTSRLLNAIYNGTGSPVRSAEADNLMKAVMKEIAFFRSKVFEYKDESDPEKRAGLKRKILAMLNPKMPFVAFKRWIIRDLGLEQEFDSAM